MRVNAERGGSTFVIEPSEGWSLPPFREVWAYRELLYFLV